MGLFDRLFGTKPRDATRSPSAGIPHALPLGLRIGGQVQFDRMMFRVAPGATTVELPDGYQGIPCYGHIDLGDGYALHRFYVDDDAYVQVSTCGDQVEGLKAFVFHETVNPPTKRAFEQFVMEHAHLGAPRIEYAGRQWTRGTNATDEQARTPPLAYDEVLYRHSPPRRDDDLTHYAMLYRRDVPELDREEFLLVTAEDSGPNEFCITYAIGFDLTPVDLDIT
jgi:hypothetical protein